MNRFMKQVKFLAVALTILMGVTFTSCMNGEENTVQTPTEFVKVESDFPLTFKTAYGIKLVAQNTPIEFEPYSTKIAILQYRFDTATQPIDQNTKKINVEVLYVEGVDGKCYEVATETDYSAANAAIMTMEIPTQYGSIKPAYFDKNYLVLPIGYRYKDVDGDALKEELKKHNFDLIYVTEKTKVGDTEMKLYLRHIIADSETTERKKTTYTYKAYDLSAAISQFENQSKEKLNSIKIYTQENQNSDKLGEEAQENNYPLDYKFEE